MKERRTDLILLEVIAHTLSETIHTNQSDKLLQIAGACQQSRVRETRSSSRERTFCISDAVKVQKARNCVLDLALKNNRKQMKRWRDHEGFDDPE
jgi:hypothetical protein